MVDRILICILLQFVSFIPFYLIWIYDCKTIGNDNLAVSLKERFFTWLMVCPIWMLWLIK